MNTTKENFPENDVKSNQRPYPMS